MNFSENSINAIIRVLFWVLVAIAVFYDLFPSAKLAMLLLASVLGAGLICAHFARSVIRRSAESASDDKKGRAEQPKDVAHRNVEPADEASLMPTIVIAKEDDRQEKLENEVVNVSVGDAFRMKGESARRPEWKQVLWSVELDRHEASSHEATQAARAVLEAISLHGQNLDQSARRELAIMVTEYALGTATLHSASKRTADSSSGKIKMAGRTSTSIGYEDVMRFAFRGIGERQEKHAHLEA